MIFPLILLILTVLCGLGVLIDNLFFKRKRQPQDKMPKLFEYAHSFFPIFFIVLVLRSFLIEPFRIPSGSLEPTLKVGDFLAVNKFIYGLRLPVFENKVLAVSEPKTGDIVVFRWPPNPKYNYVKRVIGKPHDHIVYKNKTLFINDVEAKQTFVGSTIDESSGKAVDEYEEDLNGIKHQIYINPRNTAIDFDVTVPEGYYFVLGDNRDDSADSRYWGYLPEANLKGKAFAVWLSWDGNKGNFRWHNMGHLIH